MIKEFRRQLWQPPRPHGEVIEDRSVSFLELFYDLVYVVVIARAAHHFSEHLTWAGASEFTIVFSLIWIAWINGTLLHELHGRNDVRSRAFIFAQMLILAVLAIYAGDAGSEGGARFALTYTTFLALMLWLWAAVWRQDQPAQRQMATRYLMVLGAGSLVMATSVTLDDDARLLAWALVVLGWMAASAAQQLANRLQTTRSVTESMVERFGLFTIIVLGEVVVGVVNGLSEVAVRDVTTIATGLVALTVGFGYWWTYFDLISRRLPQPNVTSFYVWLQLHLPTTLSIAAAGAAMVTLVEHASDERTPTATALTIAIATAVGLISLAATMPTLQDYEALRSVYRPTIVALVVSAVAAIVLGLLRPRPLVFASALTALLSIDWLVAVNRLLRRSELANNSG